MDDEDFDDDQHEQEFVSATTSNRDPARIYCPRCTNMWGPWEDRQQNLLMLKCNSCGHMERADNTNPVHQNFVVKQMQYVFFLCIHGETWRLVTHYPMILTLL
jgi:hypothetical protein